MLRKPTKFFFSWWLLPALLGAFTLGPCAATLDIHNRYSPRDSRRPARPETRYIVLHTTEGAETGSLRKIYRRGEAHYFVSLKGRVYRIIHKDRIATHAGRSMWEGRKVIDNYSIGIEVVGYHDKDITEAQYVALRELLRQLKSLYNISDENVITHSMVAYGLPNRFHRYYHRGRKRCGMIFADHDVRARLGLTTKPEIDTDVREGRLRVADRELHAYLFAPAPAQPAPGSVDSSDQNVISAGWTAWSIARENYNHPDTIYTFPDGTRRGGDEITDWDRIPVGTVVEVAQDRTSDGFEGFLEIGRDGDTPSVLAGEAYDDPTTIYFFPTGMIRTGLELSQSEQMKGLLENSPVGTRILLGYVYGGYVGESRPPARVAGSKWNYPSTFYRLPDGRIVSGDEIDETSIPKNTLVFYQS